MKILISLLTLCMTGLPLFSIAQAEPSEKLFIVGTGSGMPLLEAVGKAFTKHNPDIRILIPESIGSGGGIKAVGNDDYVLGRVARDIKSKEKKYGLTQTPIAKIPIAFFVNNSVSLSDITAEQACKIYNGTIRKWEEIGAGQGKIRVIKRQAGDSSLTVLQNTLAGFGDLTLTPRSKTTYTDQETIDACQGQENAIAFGSLADIKNVKGVHALALDGMPPTDPSYPHIGPLSLVYKAKNYRGTVKQFVEFIPSQAAQKAIKDAGGLPTQ